jgi:hypothetical protein
MSTGHRHGAPKTDAELYRMLGEGDTSALYAKTITLDTGHDIPYAGGASVDGRTIYVDRKLYREIMDGKVAVRGMSPRQIIQAFVEHEHTEKAVDDGDNPVDAYLGAHGFGTAKEHAFVRMLQVDPRRYEAALSDALDRCAKRAPDDPPRDLWCGPYLDDPTPRDREILRIFRVKGVADAFKASKLAAGYGVGAEKCEDCKHFSGGTLGPCEKVCGLVRWNRRCDWFEAG